MRSGNYNIAVGIDFSDSSAGAMYHALALAERLGATLHLVHVAPLQGSLAAPTDLGLNIPPEFEEAQQARERLERMRVMLGGKTAVELHLRMGEPVRGFLQLIQDLKPDMVVVGSHGRGTVMRLLLGSVSVGQGVSESIDASQTNDASSGSVNVSPAGTSGYDINPELRVRY
jgi:nucleotide-binding universal stress UspA family protein